MGGTSASATTKNNLENIINAVSSAMISTSQNCTVAQNLKNKISVGTIKDSKNITISENTTQVSAVACVLTANSTVDFKSNITTAINTTLAAAAKASGGFGGATDANTYVENNQKLVTNITNAIDITTVQNCLAAQFADNEISVKMIENSENIAITITSAQNTVLDCIAKQTAVVSAATTLAQQMTTDLSSSSTATGLSLSSIFLIIIVVVIVGLLLVFAVPSTVVSAVISVIKGLLLGFIDIFRSAFKAIFSSGGGAKATGSAAKLMPEMAMA
jgi:hypothetical protein